MATDLENCSNCKFGKEDEDSIMIICRKLPPPIARDDDERTEWEWPMTLPESWCGEYKSK